MRTTEDRVVIKPLPTDNVSAGGIIIPDEAKGKPTKAEVIMIGDDAKIKCKPGDWILFPEHAGFDFNWEGVDLKVIRWGDIQMIMDRNVRSAQEIIKTDGDIIGAFEKVLNEGTIQEMLVLHINGNPFHLQGNVLMPFVNPDTPCKEETSSEPLPQS